MYVPLIQWWWCDVDDDGGDMTDNNDGGETGGWCHAGAKVYMACRSLERARVAAQEMKQKTGVDDSRLIVMQLDLSSLSSVRSFASTFKTSTFRIYTTFQYTI